MLKIRKEDEVIVIAGRDKGRRGEVLEVLGDGRLLVSGVHLLKKHQRANPNIGQQGGIIEREGPSRLPTSRSGTMPRNGPTGWVSDSRTGGRSGFSNPPARQWTNRSN